MKDCLVIPVSQSGTTNDTNRTVDLVRARGGWIVSIVNRRIAIYDNPNAIVPVSSTDPAGPTRIPQVLSPTSYLPTNEALIDSWLGEGVLDNLCPTGSFSNISCLVDNATVRYDQMHGRYIVGMTVTDTGVETLGNVVTRPRKASWVLLIAREWEKSHG